MESRGGRATVHGRLGLLQVLRLVVHHGGRRGPQRTRIVRARRCDIIVTVLMMAGTVVVVRLSHVRVSVLVGGHAVLNQLVLDALGVRRRLAVLQQHHQAVQDLKFVINKS